MRDLDLELAGRRQVLFRDAEASGGDLLDAVERARRVLAALAAVAARAGEQCTARDRFVRFGSERPERHRCGHEPRQDCLCALDLVDRERVTDRNRLDQIAQRDRFARFELVGEGEERRFVARDDRFAQPFEQRRIEGMPDAVAPEAEHPALRRFGARRRRFVPPAQVFFELVEAQHRDVRRHPREAHRDEIAVQAEHFERLRADVRPQRADTELGEHLHEPDAYGIEELFRRSRLVRGRPRGEPRVHDVRPGGDQRRAAVRVAREPVAGRDRRLHPQSRRGQPLMERPGGEHGRQRQLCAAVVEHQIGRAVAHGAFGFVADRADARAQRARSEVERDAMRNQPRVAGQRVERALVEQRRVDRDDAARCRNVAVRVAAADERAHVEDETFAQRVDRRVGHLRETLAQVFGDRHAPLEERGRRVVAHRPHRFDAARQGEDDLLELVGCVAVANEIRSQRLAVHRRRRFGRRREAPRRDDRTKVGVLAAQRAERGGQDQLAGREAHHDPLAGPEPTAFDDRIVAEVDHAGFRCGQHLP